MSIVHTRDTLSPLVTISSMLRVVRITEWAGLGQAEPGLGLGQAPSGIFAWRMHSTNVKILSHLSATDRCESPLNVCMVRFLHGRHAGGVGKEGSDWESWEM